MKFAIARRRGSAPLFLMVTLAASACGLVVAVSALVAATAACGSGDAAPSSARDPLARVSSADAGVYLQALTHGLLTRDGDCLYVVNGGGRELLAFPRETSLARWDEKSQQLTLRGRTIALGDRIDLGGGEVAPTADFWSQPPAPECDAKLVWLVGQF